MKVNLVKTASCTFIAADDVDYQKLIKLSNGGEFICDIKLNHNAALHRKIFAFFNFCTIHYYGDSEAGKDEYKLEFVRKKLTVIAGYHKQVFSRDGTTFELMPLSLSYEKMPPEDRAKFYSKIVDAALKRVFDRTTDENVINQLINWF